MNKDIVQHFFSVIAVLVLLVVALTFVSAQENQSSNETTSETEYNFTISDNETNTTESNQSDIFEESNSSEENTTTVLICSEIQCDEGCTICSDGSCHAPEEECIVELVVEKVTPNTIKTGEQQLNVLVKNTGTVTLLNVEAEISGY